MSRSVHPALSAMFADKVVCVVRAGRIPDPAALCAALVAGGIATVELTTTTPGVVEAVRACAQVPGLHLGVGTVLTAGQAQSLVEAGATFLVTPGLRPAVAAFARRAGVALLMGAMTPTEVLDAHEQGSHAVKVFPASTLGPGYLKALSGPYPDITLVPSGGVDASNAAAFLSAGAAALTAGTSVVPPEAVADGDLSLITARAGEFMEGIRT